MLVTDKYPNYTENKDLAKHFKTTQKTAVAVCILAGISMAVCALLKEWIPLGVLSVIFLAASLPFELIKRMKHPRCRSCGFKTDYEVFDLDPASFPENTSIAVDSKGRVYTHAGKKGQKDFAGKTHHAILLTQACYICHGCKLFSPCFTRIYKQTTKIFEAIKKK